MKGFLVRLKALLVLYVVWLALMAPLSTQDLAAGLGIVLVLVLLPLPGLSVYREISLAPKRILFFILYIGVLLVEICKSNIDVALRVVQPVIPIQPGIVKVSTRLTSRLGRWVLANSITLTPGTITVETKGGDLYIHWISVTADDVDSATKKIVTQFEKYLEVIFG
ncbi:MAG: Na+/H+ antiporter subunit E [Spirochaetae bacterium HGW-Spirochaetae-2]|jgi:multicomponent Na+:H+ antiporter subunit E|nr:MAG: Na+/H+ antiporter subunit E [Spirochaetae bacterium HGW-Spirochaetae-2]